MPASLHRLAAAFVALFVAAAAGGASGATHPSLLFGRDDVPEVLAGLGTSILTTSRGVMTGREAVRAGVGGEVLCNVW